MRLLITIEGILGGKTSLMRTLSRMAFIEESDINEHTGTCHVGASSASGGAVANIADIKTRPIARSNPLDIAIKRLGGLHSSKLPSNGFVAGTIDTADQRRVSRSGISCETVRQ